MSDISSGKSSLSAKVLFTAVAFAVIALLVAVMVTDQSADQAQSDGCDAEFTFSDGVQNYNIRYHYNGATIHTDVLAYDSVIVPIAGPEKASDTKYNYNFMYWSGYSDGMKVSGDTDFYAVFERTNISSNEKSVLVDSTDSNNVRFSDSNISDLKKRSETDGQTLTVKLSKGSIDFNKAAVISFVKGDTLSIKDFDKSTLSDNLKELVGDYPVFDVDFGANNQLGNGKASVSLQYTMSDNDNIWIYYLKDGEVAQKINCEYSDNSVTFSVNHFSTYAAVNEKSESTTAGYSPMVIVVGAVLAVIVLLIFAFVLKRAQNKL